MSIHNDLEGSKWKTLCAANSATCNGPSMSDSLVQAEALRVS